MTGADEPHLDTAGALPEPTEDAPVGSGRASALVAAGILLSRVAGLVRERAIGHFLGAGAAVDAFRAALRIPNLLQNLLGEGVLSAAFIPSYSRLLAEGRREEAARVAAAIAGLLTVVAGLLVVVGVVFAEPLTAVLAWGFPGAKRDLTVRLVRILTPGIGFLVLSAWCLGVLNSHRRFFLSYVAPVLWNAAMIAALVAGGMRGLGDEALAVALAWGTVAGGVLQLGMQLPTVLRLTRGARISLRVGMPPVRRIIRATGPVIGGRGVVQLSAYVDLVIATFLATGGAAALGFAQVFYLLPISLFGMSVAAAELPELSRADRSDLDGLVVRLDARLRRIAFFVVPTAVVYVVLGDVVVGALYQGGEFTADITLQVWAVLAAYSLGLLASTASRLLQSALYGFDDTRTPAVASIVRVLVSATLGTAVMLQLDRVVVDVAGVALTDPLPALAPVEESLRAVADNQRRLGAAGLALGAAVGAWIEYLLLRRVIGRRIGRVRLGGGSLARTATAAAAGAAAGAAARAGVDAAFGDLHPILAAAPVLGGTLLVYLATAAALRLEEVATVRSVLGRRRGGGPSS